jgi:hypothetical protein
MIPEDAPKKFAQISSKSKFLLKSGRGWIISKSKPSKRADEKAFNSVFE